MSIPTETIMIPSTYTLNKLCKESTTPSLDDDTLALTKVDNSTHSFMSLSSIKARVSVIKDRDLTWEELSGLKSEFKRMSSYRVP
ncbi:hypothetical protein PAXINDRAFT_12850 [Paxillus involutus ATCC 200175]|uniref:Uncharacterized protein n=1 Tax=Paxillus involutus ATCC 200175 TaxID=664439 RepID=A0A0C9TF42_PAXIN|nr:hypothetical protein PAXINDRAFT_12850 [Paxillus involutus ATCC 200175]